MKKNNTMNQKISWPPGTMLYPIPAVLVSCGNIETGYNLLTIAWTGITCSDPAMCYISVRPERYSYELIKKTGEFCINLTTVDLAFATDWCGVKSGRDFNKFKEMKLTPLPGQTIKTPLIAESPVNLECQVTEIKPLGTHHMFLANITAVHASKEYLNPKTNALDLSHASMLCFAHGKYYHLGRTVGKFGFSVQKKKKTSRPRKY